MILLIRTGCKFSRIALSGHGLATTSGQEQGKVGQKKGEVGQEICEVGQEICEVGQEICEVGQEMDAVGGHFVPGEAFLEHLTANPDRRTHAERTI